MTILVAIAVATVLSRGIVLRFAPSDRARCDRGGDEAEFTELVAMALSAGHGFPAAVRLAAAVDPGPVAERALRGLRSGAASEADLEVLRVAHRAATTGAPLGATVEALASRLRRERRAMRRARLQRLPVRLLFPLALLILPGTLVLSLGPILLGALQRLGT